MKIEFFPKILSNYALQFESVRKCFLLRIDNISLVHIQSWNNTYSKDVWTKTDVFASTISYYLLFILTFGPFFFHFLYFANTFTDEKVSLCWNFWRYWLRYTSNKSYILNKHIDHADKIPFSANKKTFGFFSLSRSSKSTSERTNPTLNNTQSHTLWYWWIELHVIRVVPHTLSGLFLLYL